MESLLTLLGLLNTLSPLAVIALLGVVIFMLVKGKTSVDGKVTQVATNHLHEMPELVETIRDMHKTLISLDAYLRVRLNGGGHGR